MKKFALIVLTVVAVVLAGCQAQPKPDEIVMAATRGWNTDNISATQVDTALSYLSDDAMFKMVGFPPQIPAEFKGKEAIRAAYEGWLPLHPRLQVDVIKVEGNTVSAKTQYWSDPMRSMGVAPLVGADVYIVENGKIISETWTLDNESQTKFASAFVAAQAAPAASVSIGDFPTGSYTYQDWSWELKADGSYVSRDRQGGGEKGIFTVTGNQISLKGDYCGDITGIYAWAYDGTALTFSAVDDKCTDRLDTVVSAKWVKKP